MVALREGTKFAKERGFHEVIIITDGFCEWGLKRKDLPRKIHITGVILDECEECIKAMKQCVDDMVIVKRGKKGEAVIELLKKII